MKELYTAPEAKLLCFAPVEALANNKLDINADALFGGNNLFSGDQNGLDLEVPY